jgi:hypothetical protein
MHPMPCPPIRVRALRAAWLVVCAAAPLVALPAQAFDAAKSAAKGKPLLLSREELRACMASQSRLHQQREETTQLQSLLAIEKDELTRSGTELNDQLAALDRTNLKAVEKYVEAHNAREKRIDAYEARAGAYNAKVEAMNTEQDAYARTCENRRFDETDELVIRKGK